VGTATSADVVAGLDIHPPERLVVGKGNVFMIGGYCYHRRKRTRRLYVEVAGSRQPVERLGLPRLDAFERRNGDGGERQAFHSGFVAMPAIGPREASEDAEVSLVLSLAGGEEARVPVGRVRLEPRLSAPPEASTAGFPETQGPRVAICMATFNPPEDLLGQQLDSLREQTHGNWVCVLSDDHSDPPHLEGIQRQIEGDPRFVLARGERRLGFYGNFERALSMAPASADFVTLCDQDDRWHPNKLERLLEEIGGGAQLAYSDARVVDPDGDLIHDSYWTVRRNNYTNFGSLLLANSITGAASLFHRELLDDVLPFPPNLANPFHDHWLAVVALARGEIAYVDEPLYDYVQHGGAVIGHSTANKRPRPIRQHLMERLRRPGTGSRVVYYYNWHQQLLFAKVLRQRCWDQMTALKRRTLRRLLGADSGVLGLSWLLGRRVRRLWGHDETLDRELFYAYALVRRRAVSILTLGRRRPGRLLPRDASIPPAPASIGAPEPRDSA
jgi:glycosyltransferase involved in cell wall biosynthesis